MYEDILLKTLLEILGYNLFSPVNLLCYELAFVKQCSVNIVLTKLRQAITTVTYNHLTNEGKLQMKSSCKRRLN